MKPCPFCAEMIQDAAKKCRFCREYLDEDVAQRQSKAVTSQRPLGRRGTPCPKCNSRYQESGPWPWYLGTVGAILCRAVVCTECGHHFDAKKPHVDLGKRKRNLAIIINGIGGLGILFIIGSLVLFAMSLDGRGRL